MMSVEDDTICEATKSFRNPHKCITYNNVQFEFDDFGELIAVSRCLFCKRIIRARLIETLPYRIEKLYEDK